jgi:hypothetical protein
MRGRKRHFKHRKKGPSGGGLLFTVSGPSAADDVEMIDDPTGDLYGSVKPEVERRFGKKTPPLPEPLRFDYTRKMDL